MENKEYILITGASSGMGREMAIRFSDKFNLILHGRNIERLEETRDLCSSNNLQILWPFDLEDVDHLETVFTDFLHANNLGISYFVHSAGYMKTYPLKMVTPSLFRSTFNINVISASLIIKLLMNRRLNGEFLKSIVLVSSNISNFGAKAFSVYGASKGAVDALMRSLAVELAPRVRVNSVLPGGVRTAMTEHMYENEELIKRMYNLYPLGGGDVSNIYDAVSFLLSERASWITGQQLTVDGGRTINITG